MAPYIDETETVSIHSLKMALVKAQESVKEAEEAIVKFQKDCRHDYKLVSQANAYHEFEWNQHFVCKICENKLVKKNVSPVCYKCNGKLERVMNNVSKPAPVCSELFAPGMEDYRLRAYKCNNTSCLALNIFMVNGD
jgi:hypothetical protein